MARSLRPFDARRALALAPALVVGSCAIGVALIGCFASIDRSKIDDGVTGEVDAGPPGADGAAADAPAADASMIDAGGLLPGQSPCGATHDFCVDFDKGGTTPTDYGFDLALAGSGTGMVTIGSGGYSPSRCAHVTTMMDPIGSVPNFSDGLAHSIDPTRPFELAFDVLVQLPNWTGYNTTRDFEIATVATSDNFIELRLEVANPKLVDGGNDQLLIDLRGSSGPIALGAAPFTFGSWMHIDIVAGTAGLSVTVGGKTGLSHSPIAFASSSAGTAFVLGVIRPTDGAPASNVHIDNVVLDYR